jgi:hypothetical protein
MSAFGSKADMTGEFARSAIPWTFKRRAAPAARRTAAHRRSAPPIAALKLGAARSTPAGPPGQPGPSARSVRRQATGKIQFRAPPASPAHNFLRRLPGAEFFRLPRVWCRCAATNRALPLATGRAKLRNDLGADQRFGRGCVFCGDRSFHDAQDARRLRL